MLITLLFTPKIWNNCCAKTKTLPWLDLRCEMKCKWKENAQFGRASSAQGDKIRFASDKLYCAANKTRPSHHIIYAQPKRFYLSGCRTTRKYQFPERVHLKENTPLALCGGGEEIKNFCSADPIVLNIINLHARFVLVLDPPSPKWRAKVITLVAFIKLKMCMRYSIVLHFWYDDGTCPGGLCFMRSDGR